MADELGKCVFEVCEEDAAETYLADPSRGWPLCGPHHSHVRYRLIEEAYRWTPVMQWWGEERGNRLTFTEKSPWDPIK